MHNNAKEPETNTQCHFEQKLLEPNVPKRSRQQTLIEARGVAPDEGAFDRL